MIGALKSAAALLTVVPVKADASVTLEDVGRSAWTFPLVGAGIGLLLVAAHFFFEGRLPPSVSAVIIVTFWIFLTGALHLDGWADCCDALIASTSPERRYEILKDSRLGSFGAIGIVALLAIKTVTIAAGGLPVSMLVLAPILGRTMMVVAAYDAPSGPKGMASGFIAGVDRGTVVLACLIGFIPALIIGWTGVVAAAFAYVATRILRRIAVKRLGFVNGDVIGSVCELSEATVLFVACVKW